MDPARGPVLHVDLDAFIAAVEVLRRPELAGRPVVVGGRGDPTERGVVATASYEAREHGVGSGMPLRVAARRCPDAVFLAVDKPAYDAASAVVMDTLRACAWGGVPVVVEVLGWDEAFVGPGPGHGDLEPAVELAQRVRAAVLEATGLHCSVGIGDNKLQAKTATDFGKPRGVFAITDETWFDQMGHRPTRSLWGIGAKTAGRLADLGITTVAELAASDAGVLAEAIGPRMGPWYHRIGRGADTSPVDATPWVPRAHGREETFQTDLTTRAEIEQACRELTRRVVADIDGEGRAAARVGLKVRLRPFTTLTRSLTLPVPTNDAQLLADAAVSLLDRVEALVEADGAVRAVRLLGVRLEMVAPAGGY